MTEPNMKMKALMSFPSSVVGSNGIDIEKSNGQYTVKPTPDTANNLVYYQTDETQAGLPSAAGGLLNTDANGVPSVTPNPVLGVSGSVTGTMDFSGITSGTTRLQSQDAASGTVKLPAASTTLIGQDTTDTLTNKTFDTAGTGNVLKINGLAVTDHNGTGNVVLSSSPTITSPTLNGSPVLGAASATSITASGLLQAGTTLGISTDVLLFRDAAAALALRNGATAQETRIYNTFTDLSNYERGSLGWVANPNWLTLRSTNAGTGTARGIVIASATGIIAHGGTTSSFPAIKRNGAAINFRLADDSGDATVTAKTQAGSDNSTNVATTAAARSIISNVAATQTFTPTLAFATPGTSSWSYATQTAFYVQIGNMIILEIDITATPTIGTGTGNLIVGTLPVAINASTDPTGDVGKLASTWTWPASRTMVVARPNTSTTLNIVGQGSGQNPLEFAASNMTSGSAHSLRISMTYFV